MTSTAVERAVKTACVVAGLGCALGAAGCRLDQFNFYDVTRTPTEECDILPEGEFCDPDALSPPTTETWSVERVDNVVRVYVDEEVWVASPPGNKDDPNLVKASKLEVDTRDPGGCTNTITRDFQVLATDADITGQLHEKTRLVGGQECGDTPRGLRTTARIDGTIAGAP